MYKLLPYVSDVYSKHNRALNVFLLTIFTVERRRRDKINNWIVQLSKLVPDCANDHKQGQVLRTEVICILLIFLSIHNFSFHYKLTLCLSNVPLSVCSFIQNNAVLSSDKQNCVYISYT